MQVPRQFLSKKPIKNGANRQMCACVGTSHFILLVLSISSEMVAIRRVTQGSAAPSIDHGTARARNTMLGVAGALVVCVVVLSLMMKHSKRRRVTGVCTRTQTADEGVRVNPNPNPNPNPKKGVKTCAFFYCASNEQHVHWHDVDVKLGRQHTTVQQSFSGMIRLPPSNSVQRQDILQGPGGWLNQPGPTYNHKLAQTDCRVCKAHLLDPNSTAGRKRAYTDNGTYTIDDFYPMASGPVFLLRSGAVHSANHTYLDRKLREQQHRDELGARTYARCQQRVHAANLAEQEAQAVAEAERLREEERAFSHPAVKRRLAEKDATIADLEAELRAIKHTRSLIGKPITTKFLLSPGNEHMCRYLTGTDQAGLRIAISMARTPSMLEILESGSGSKSLSNEQQFLLFHIRVTQGLPYGFILWVITDFSETGTDAWRRIATRCFEKILIAHSLLVDKSWGRVWPVEWIDDLKADMYRGPFDDITNIADCSNTQTKQPSRNHAEKKALYSSYYSMTCGKWAVSMSPVGLVSWVSKMYAGCTSDQRIIVDSNIWGAMYPGRTLLYDKGGGLLDQLAHKMGYGYACPYRMVEGDLTHCEQRASHALSTRRAPVERLIGWIKKRCMVGSYILHRQDFCLADDVLKVCSFFQHFDGPIAFNKQYGDSDVAIPLLTEDLSDIAGGTNNSSDGFDDDDDWDSEEEPLSDSGGSDEGEL